jgi:DNA repair exonuclease SbcCD ATPase subunit
MGGKNRSNRREDYGNDQWYSDNQGQDRVTTNGVEGGQDMNLAPSNSISNLGPFSQAADEAISKMLAAKNAIELLGEVFSRYSQEIKEIPNIQKRSEDMEKQCTHKDRVIREHKVTIGTLTQNLHEKKNEVADELAKLDGDKEALKEEKEAFKRQSKDADKRHKDLEMELMSNHEKILAKKETELKVVCDARQEALEEDKKKWEARHSKMMKALETSNQEGKRKITDLEAQLEACRAQLRNEKMRYEDLEAAKTKYREEKEELATKLQNLESEFCIDSQTDKF